MNIYKGCCHGCIYCDSRSDCYHIDNFDEIRAKFNTLSIIERDRTHALWQLFQSECDKYGLLYTMEDIIEGYTLGYGNTQLTLFD